MVFPRQKRRRISSFSINGFSMMNFFIFSKKMNPETISIPDCHLGSPVKRSTGKLSFCLVPCLNNDTRLQVKLKTKFKVFAHQEDSFSLGITIPEEQLDFFTQLESHLNSAAKKMKPEIAKLGQSFARFQEGDFTLVKTDKSEQEKIYAKIYPSKIPTTDFSCRFWELCQPCGTPGGKRRSNPFCGRKISSTCRSGGKLFFPSSIFSAEMSKQSPALWMKFWWKK